MASILLVGLVAAVLPLAQAGAPITVRRDMVVLASCSTPAPSVAKLFTYEDKGSYKKITSTRCGQSYILYPRDGKKPENLGPDFKYFAVPLNKVAVTHKGTNTFLEALNVRKKIVVASGETTSACLAKEIADGAVKAFVDESQITDSTIDAIFAQPGQVSTWTSNTDLSNRIICDASGDEESPLASAEWIKFFGFFFDVDSTDYCDTWSRYKCNSLEANKKTTAPKVVFASKDADTFLIHMPPSTNQAVIDAGAAYPDLSTFNEFKKTDRFIFPAAKKTKFHAALRLADVLIDKSLPHKQTQKEIADLYSLAPVMIGQVIIIWSDILSYKCTSSSLIKSYDGFAVGSRHSLPTEMILPVSIPAAILAGRWLATVSARSSTPSTALASWSPSWPAPCLSKIPMALSL